MILSPGYDCCLLGWRRTALAAVVSYLQRVRYHGLFIQCGHNDGQERNNKILGSMDEKYGGKKSKKNSVTFSKMDEGTLWVGPAKILHKPIFNLQLFAGVSVWAEIGFFLEKSCFSKKILHACKT